MSTHSDDRVAVVTGAARGIGRSIADILAAAGFHLVVVDVDGAEEAARDLGRHNSGIRAEGLACDVRSRSEVEAAVARIVGVFARIDVLVNNAGTVARVGLDDLTDELWDRDVGTNLKGTFLFTQAVLYPHMIERGSGSIINISSVSGLMGGVVSQGEAGNRSGASYAASKGGVVAFTKWVAKEVGGHGIRVNSVAPGPVETSMTGGQSYAVGGQAIARMGQPEEIGHAVEFLASDRSSFVTGQTLSVCGGASMV